ncbi:COX15/CtaA family protein [Candidatus Poseidoniaceae archaeon]|nr:COX15/CtaA family protein [Candidatus Poseidoniaceae archaeon]
MDAKWYRRPSTLPLAIAMMAMVIVVAGGTIRIYDAGESCPDWPQCFGTWGFDISEEQQGEWFNETEEFDSRGEDHRYTTFEIFTEWIHRFLASLMAIPVLANFLIIWKRKQIYGDKLVKVSFFTGILLMVQGLAGAITVKYDNADWSVALHLGLASSFLFILIWQYLSMRKLEGVKWAVLSAPPGFKQSQFKRLMILTIAIFSLLILGAWVSSSADGNQGCSVGFPDGWPKCQGDFFPTMDASGILVQMVHRLGAGVVGIALILGGMKFKEKTNEFEAHLGYHKCLDLATGFWLMNVVVGGMYVVFAKMGDFPEGLSLLHLIIGVASFLSISVGLIMLQLSEEGAEDE